jgi:preprotein translocase subunit SecD
MYEHSPSRSRAARSRTTLLAALAVLALLPVMAAVPGADQAVADDATAGTEQMTTPIRFEMRLVSEAAQDGWIEHTFVPTGETIYLCPEVALDARDVARAWPETQGGDPVVGIYLTEDGALALARLTTEHVGERIAFLLDGEVVSTPRIMAAITGGRALIAGNFNQDEAREIADRLTAAIAARDAD